MSASETITNNISHYDSALTMARAMREGSITSRQLVELHIERILRLDDELNAIVQRNFQHARQQADQCDALIRTWRAQQRQEDESNIIELPPFCGVPMTIKAGTPTPGFHVSAGDPSIWLPSWITCTVSEEFLKKSGVVLMGKTNLPFYLCDWETNNPVHGRTGNPYNLTKTPGGSSGGAAAALAAGLTPLELGSDIGGSVRLPSVFCGVVGHVATRGVVPALDIQLGCASCVDRLINRHLEHSAWMGRYGPMARTAEDVTALLTILGGDMAAGLQQPRTNSRLADYRVAIWRTNKVFPPGTEIQHAMETAVAALKAAGATVDELEVPMDPMESYRIYLLYLSAFMKDHLPREQKANAKAGRPQDSYPDDIKSPFAEMDLACVHGIPDGTQEAFEKATIVWDDCFKQYDAVLSPIAPCGPWTNTSAPRDMLAQATVVDLS